MSIHNSIASFMPVFQWALAVLTRLLSLLLPLLFVLVYELYDQGLDGSA